jgi:hypothetical protein
MSVEPSPNFVAGGYFITRPVARSPDRSPGVLPSHLISLSSCISVFAPGQWALPWGGVQSADRAAIASEFGIDESQLPEIAGYVQLCMDRGEWGWPCVWHSATSALEFAQRFCDPEGDWIVLGADLDARHVEAFLKQARPAPNMGTPGIYEAISQGRSLASAGRTLGWEMLGYDTGGTFHSWLCHGLEVDVLHTYAVRPNAHGLITSEAEVDVVVTHCEKPEVGMEPGFWAPWRLVQYDRP